MSTIPGGTERIRPFVPAKDFDLSKRFYEALGFEKVLDGEVTIMLQLLVDDLDAWWAHIDGLDLASRFGVQPPKPPAMQPWGVRTAYVYDPCGVLWHVAQRREETIQDS